MASLVKWAMRRLLLVSIPSPLPCVITPLDTNMLIYVMQFLTQRERACFISAYKPAYTADLTDSTHYLQQILPNQRAQIPRIHARAFFRDHPLSREVLIYEDPSWWCYKHGLGVGLMDGQPIRLTSPLVFVLIGADWLSHKNEAGWHAKLVLLDNAQVSVTYMNRIGKVGLARLMTLCDTYPLILEERVHRRMQRLSSWFSTNEDDSVLVTWDVRRTDKIKYAFAVGGPELPRDELSVEALRACLERLSILIGQGDKLRTPNTFRTRHNIESHHELKQYILGLWRAASHPKGVSGNSVRAPDRFMCALSNVLMETPVMIFDGRICDRRSALSYVLLNGNGHDKSFQLRANAAFTAELRRFRDMLSITDYPALDMTWETTSQAFFEPDSIVARSDISHDEFDALTSLKIRYWQERTREPFIGECVFLEYNNDGDGRGRIHDSIAEGFVNRENEPRYASTLWRKVSRYDMDTILEVLYDPDLCVYLEKIKPKISKANYAKWKVICEDRMRRSERDRRTRRLILSYAKDT